MELLPKKWINRVGFRKLLVWTFSIGIILLALITTMVTTTLSARSVSDRLLQEGVNLTKTVAERSRVSLLYLSKSEAKYVADTMLAFPDLQEVSIFDNEKKLLYGTGEKVDHLKHDSLWPNSLGLVSENSEHWHFVAPVYTGSHVEDDSPFLSQQAQAELVGYVRVVLGKESMHRMAVDIFRYNLLVSLALAALLLIILLAITTRITNPIRDLATIMGRAKEGEKEARAEIKGTRDVIEMEIAFNQMMDVLDEREKELRGTRDLALEAARVKGEFAANVSHELRTPLNGVLGMLELLEDMGLTEKQTEYIEIASNSAESLLQLIDDILDFSKIDSGKINTENVSFVLDDMLEDIIVLLSTQAQRKDIDIAYMLDSEVPHALQCDMGRLRQVLINLVGNALKFTEQGEVGIEVSVQERHKDYLELLFKVTDTGIGMADNAREKIFEAFSQADGSTTRKYGGTGLGLAISKQIIQFMGGEIGVDSEPGKGSQFWFTLPVAIRVDETVSALTQETIPEPEKLRVLVVDDSPLNRRYLGGMLNRLKIPCDFAENGAVALDKLRLSAANRQNYHLVLMDEVMPGLKGSDLAHLVVNEPSIANTKILMMVNRVNPTYEDTHRLNIAGFLAKPVLFKDLAGKMNGLYRKLEFDLGKSTKVADVDVNASKIETFSGNKVLIVEDNRANQQVASGMLERLGCKSTFVNNGREALEMLSRETFNLVLMDCHMPEMDGYEATSQIRRLETETSRVPIVAMTANVQKGESKKCLAVGMNDYLAKPLKLGSLQATLSKWLEVKEYVTAETGDGSFENEIAVCEFKEADKEIIDGQVFKELHKQIGSALPTMVKVFLDDMPSYIRSLKDAVNVKDTQASADFAHSIKGAASNFGAYRLTNVCAEIEEKGRADISEGMEELLDKLIAECGLLQLALERKVSPDKESVEQDKNYDLLYGISENSATDHSLQRILIVDDDRGMRFAMRKVLEKDGYRVDHVNNGEQALAYCERFLPDLVLMDAIMPEMDGFKACSEIQALAGGKSVPVLIITALNDETSIGRAFAAGATDYISKPVNFAVLRKRIARILQASRAEKHVLKLAYNDTLTGLPNRTLFTEQLTKTLEDVPEGNMAAILFLDLDRFKLVNDTFGHDAGDLLLKVVAERLQRCIRQGDIISRFGGDEFTIVLNRIKSFSSVERIASKIHETLSRPFVFLGKEMHVNTSVGISLYPNDGEEIGVLLKNADIAMYRAKEKGNCYEFYEQKMEVDVARRLGIETDLRGAIARGEIVVFYQPQEDLHTGALIGMEALVRWQHPDRGLVSPLEFIPLAEETGQIFELGEYVMKTACAQLKQWLDRGQAPIRIAVNLAGRQLDREDITTRVAEILGETGLPADCLELEITESTIMKNAEQVIETLKQLKEMGVMLAIDDFGTGYSSLNYLKKFPIDLLKIDRAFVSNITSDKVDGDIVTTIITLAHSLGVKVIAEGVETKLQKEYLTEKKCNYMQGYYLGKPVPAEEFEKAFLSFNRKVH